MKIEPTHEKRNRAAAHSQPQRRGSLKLRLLAWFLAVSLVPLSVVVAISYYTAKKSLRDNAYAAVARDVEQRAAFFNNWFNYRLVDLESQATSVSNSKFLQELRDAFKSGGENPGKFTRSNRWRAIADERGEDLETFCRLYGYYDVLLIDVEGNILFTVAEAGDMGTNLFDGPYAGTHFAAAFRETLESGRPVFSDIEHITPTNDDVTAFFTEVIMDENGEKIGAFAIQITSEHIEHATQSAEEKGAGIHAYVIGISHDADSVTLRSRVDRIVPTESGTQSRDLQLDDSSRYLEQYVDTEQTRLWFSEHGPGGNDFAEMDEGAFVYDGPDGSRVLGIHKDFFIAGVNWGLIAEIPEEVAFAPAAHLRNLMVTLVLATGVTVVIIAIIITGRIVRPIVRLSHVARLVAAGDLNQEMHTSATDEIGELACSFNEMVSSLKNMFAELSNQKSALDEHAIVSIADIRGNIIHANDKFCEISGHSRDELLGQNHRMVKSGEHPPEFYRELWKTIAGGRVWSGEVRNRARDGSHYWVDQTIVPFLNADGRIERYVAIRTDITRVKEAEENARRFALELENTNLELGGQKEEAEAMNAELLIINAALETARVEATVATKAKSDFLANMSHEIRTPMTAILGFSENLRNGDLSESETHEAIETIHNNGGHLLCLINDILDVSKIEAGKMKLEQIACSVHEIMTDTAKLMKIRSDAKNLVFNTEVIGSIPETIQSDPTRLKQILINIIGNAIKFTDEGGVRLIARFVPDQVTPSMQFDVVDTGVGLTEEQVGRLFQAFIQADSTMSRKFGGTGLGLTISKSFAEMLGGNISVVNSAPGCGTRFRTTIATGPLEGVRMVDAVTATRGTTSSKPSGASQSNKPLDCRILLAEDGPDNQRLISFVLKKAGAEVTVAENGQIAFDLAMAAVSEGKPFDVILMDMQMPVLDGYKATMSLRERGYKGPVIAVTAHAMAADREKCIDSGCDDFASKPVDRQKLIELIRTYVSRKETAILS